MAARNAGSALHRIYLKDFDGSDDWFDIAARLSNGDGMQLREKTWRDLNGGMMKTEGDNQPLGAQLLYIAHQMYNHLLFGLRAWSFTRKGPDGIEEPWPLPSQFDREGMAVAINELDQPLGDFMARKAYEYYSAREDGAAVAPTDPPSDAASSTKSASPTPASSTRRSRRDGSTSAASSPSPESSTEIPNK